VDLRRSPIFPGEFAPADLCDRQSVADLISGLQPAEIYHLAAYHHSTEERKSSPEVLEISLRVNTLSTGYILDAIATGSPASRLFYAASSRIFGHPSSKMQNEETPLAPICEYGVSKVAGIHLCRLYRKLRGTFAAVGILFNHESPLRSPSFITRKLSQAAAEAKLGIGGSVSVRNGRALVDWGAAEDYVEAMRLMLALPEPEDFVIASGRTHSVADFAQLAYARAGLDSKQFLHDDGAVPVGAETVICGDASRLRRVTGWAPKKSLADVAAEMVDNDIQLLQQQIATAAGESRH
jgi:GDPmannose 4,6-dehydratase